ncbi:reverse transcriptase [Apostichopus japonicus]|uniref:Reverse transcriptase n=1 Tax=Stichopus japonicus TaxID=307972 RepID=A0A2G8JW09_STIJA|nr:reverse transcriptase [Apostichopus japonicus]
MTKRAIVEATEGEGPLFRSSFFLTPKKDGSWRPILNLKPLNKGFVRPTHFRMETLAIVVPNLTKGMWASSVDLKDAYLHIPVETRSQNFLAFSYKGKTYKFVALPFGLSTSPRVFTRIAGAVVGRPTPKRSDLICLPRRLARHGEVAPRGTLQPRSHNKSPRTARLGNQQGKITSHPDPDHSISGRNSRFSHWLGETVLRAGHQHPTNSSPPTQQAVLPGQTLDESPRPHGQSGGRRSILPSQDATSPNTPLEHYDPERDVLDKRVPLNGFDRPTSCGGSRRRTGPRDAPSENKSL